MRDEFIGWQCRIRQHAFRTQGGRPSSGMRPRITRTDGSEVSDAVTVLLIESDPAESIAQFRHLVRQSHDPARRYDAAVRLLSSAYYQSMRGFSDRMTALFSISSPIAALLQKDDDCLLDFDQFSQRYSLPCAVATLDEDDPAFQVTYWHNFLFNPALPGKVQILSFAPDWDKAEPQ